MHVDRTCKAARLFRLSNPSGICRKARRNTRHEHQIARSPLWLSDIRRKNSRRMREADRADAEPWPIRMAGTRAGPAQPFPTIAQMPEWWLWLVVDVVTVKLRYHSA